MNLIFSIFYIFCDFVCLLNVIFDIFIHIPIKPGVASVAVTGRLNLRCCIL